MQHRWITQNTLFWGLVSDCRPFEYANSFPPFPAFVLSYANPALSLSEYYGVCGGSLAALGSVQSHGKKMTETHGRK